ncbi:MAG TPA: hypothetical protein ENH19_01975, partial [Actinobacteria bacterium]|nr:hypothetical protein [Actinomycetes bacterium]HEX21404.1 hypothetical protein [Actinomycetota bacterium]
MLTLYDIYMNLKESGSSSDFPNLLADKMHKKLLSAFKGVNTNWDKWCAINANMTDFKPHETVVLGEIGDLLEVLPTEEPIDSSMGEHVWTNQLKTYKRSFKIDRRTIINDDLKGIMTVPDKFGRASVRTIAKKAINYLETNPNTYDGNALFSVAHNNLGSTALTADETGANAVDAALNAIETATDNESGEIMGLNARYLVVPVALYKYALVLRDAEQIPNAAGTALVPNVVRGRFEVVKEPLFTDNNDWYVVADPNDIPTVEVGFLNNKRVP